MSRSKSKSKGKGEHLKDDVLEKTIKERKKLPKSKKDNVTDSIFYNVLFLIIFMVIAFYSNYLFNNTTLNNFSNIMKAFQIGTCVIALIILEVAFREKSQEIALYGIEFLLFSVFLLFMPYMYIVQGRFEYMQYILEIYVVYYICKSLVTIIRMRNKYVSENLSDVKEIVVDEKAGYLDEESTKTINKDDIVPDVEKENETEATNTLDEKDDLDKEKLDKEDEPKEDLSKEDENLNKKNIKTSNKPKRTIRGAR